MAAPASRFRIAASLTSSFSADLKVTPAQVPHAISRVGPCPLNSTITLIAVASHNLLTVARKGSADCHC